MADLQVFLQLEEWKAVVMPQCPANIQRAEPNPQPMEGGFSVIQALGPVYMGSSRGTGWFSALEVSMNPHKQGPSPQNCPSINPVLT